MKQRIITAVILAPLVVLGIFYLSMPLFIAALAAVTLIGFWEWTQFVEARSRLMAMLPCVAVTGAVLALFPFDSAGLQAVAQPHLIQLMVAALWWIAASALAIGYPGTTGLWQNSRVLRHLFGWLTLLPFFTSVVLLRAVPGEDAFYGARLVLFVCFLVWSADSGAYFAGKSFGRTKMAPNVSPNKTIEGLAGGIIAALIVGLGAAHWFEIQFASWWHFAGITLVTVVISVLGDLVESMFKRVSGIKDSSNIIPGHGGVLDRIDSLTAAFPVFALLYFTL